jgi:hypothetical protein
VVAEPWWSPWAAAIVPYAALLRLLIDGRVSGEEFEVAFLPLYKRDRTDWPPEIFDVLDGFLNHRCAVIVCSFGRTGGAGRSPAGGSSHAARLDVAKPLPVRRRTCRRRGIELQHGRCWDHCTQGCTRAGEQRRTPAVSIS